MMISKKIRRFVLPLFCLLALLVGCQGGNSTLQVNDLVADPGAYTGQLSVVGVVNTYDRNDGTIVGVMDKNELMCTTPNCEKQLLPVRIRSNRPNIGDEVKISGTFGEEGDWGYVLNAINVQVLAKHQLGG